MERTEEDSYLTLAEPAEALYKEKGSKFLAYAYPVSSEEQIRECLEALRKRYYDATHHCYAWRLGADGQNYRVNDDGEPSSTAGRPILGQLLSYGVTDVLVVVVRYFGGTKLGVSGLIAAYKESAAAVALGVGRAIGEAMAVIMVSGNVANMPSLFQSVRFLTTAVSSEMAYAAGGSLHRQALFSIALVLFLFIMIINAVLNFFLKKRKGEN